jgi:hypothetical protein
MKKELVKLAYELDKIGYAKIANKVDSLLIKISIHERWDVLYETDWKQNWWAILPVTIRAHYYGNERRAGTQKSLDSYIKENKVSDFQLEKLISSVQDDPRWTDAKNSEAAPEVEATPEVELEVEITAEDFHKLLIADRDPSNPYKMSDETFRLGRGGKGKLTPQDLEIIRKN